MRIALYERADWSVKQPQLEEETDMGREQMRNLETYKVGANAVNEFEYQQNQGELTEQLEHHPDQPDSPAPLTQAERVEQIMAEAHEKVEERKRRGISSFGKPAAKKSTGKHSATKKSAAKKSTAKKSGAKKQAKNLAGKKTSPKKVAGKKASGNRAPVRKSATAKSAGKKVANRSTTKRSPARKSGGKKSAKGAARRRS